MDILIFGGQSNMQGQTECLSENAVVEGAWEYKFLTDEAVPLKNPVGEDITYDGTQGYPFMENMDGEAWLQTHVLASACYGHTNMVPAFCRSYIAQTGSNVLAVHTAKGSTTIAQWLPGSAGYEMLKRKVLAAKAKAAALGEIGRIGFVWLQGESDAIEGNSKAYYKEKIRQLADALMQDLGVEKFGVIRVGCFVNDDRDWQIIDAQDEICNEDADFVMLTRIATELNKSPEHMNPRVGGHYGAKGLETLGEAAGKALAECFLNR